MRLYLYVHAPGESRALDSNSGLAVNQDNLPELEGPERCHCARLTLSSDRIADPLPQVLKILIDRHSHGAQSGSWEISSSFKKPSHPLQGAPAGTADGTLHRFGGKVVMRAAL